jgi:phosphopantothenoylcysteine decarboxylase/phosphopantothenate--cysteine ligase
LKVVFGVTGGIAAYKAAETVRRLAERGDEIQVIFTRNASEFVAPLTFSVLSRRPVLTGLFDDKTAPAVDHVELAAWADLLLIAPATADVIAKLARGIADDFLSTYHLSHHKPVLLAPAMESAMWAHPAVAENVETLRRRDVRLVGPKTGPLASGRSGVGRMAEPEEIVRAAVLLIEGKCDLEGLRVLVTAGPTRERIDPIRLLTNRSSGRMGFALAEAARDRGAAVTLLAGPGSAAAPDGVALRRFESVRDLQKLLDEEFERCDVLAMAAAVSDFIPEEIGRRLHRSEGSRSVTLTPGPDLLAGLAPRKGQRLVVAFAAEGRDAEENARRKMEAKGADWIVVNDVSRPDIGFDAQDNEVLLLSRSGKRLEVSRRPKREIAEKIWDAVSSDLSWKTIPEQI